jgi:single-strand DNA-binding protein
MSDSITLTGLVATTPRFMRTAEGTDIASFRLASNQRRFDRASNAWLDGDTNWYTVVALGRLAISVSTSVTKGSRVLLCGSVRIADWESGSSTGTSVEIHVESLGLDLSYPAVL